MGQAQRRWGGARPGHLHERCRRNRLAAKVAGLWQGERLPVGVIFRLDISATVFMLGTEIGLTFHFDKRSASRPGRRDCAPSGVDIFFIRRAATILHLAESHYRQLCALDRDMRKLHGSRDPREGKITWPLFAFCFENCFFCFFKFPFP
jgi:hypothetical protein